MKFTPLDDWSRPSIFGDAKDVDDAYHDRTGVHRGGFTCVLCDKQASSLRATSIYNGVSKICLYCHHSELVLMEHLMMEGQDGRSGQRSIEGMDIIPMVGPHPHSIIRKHETPIFTDAWMDMVTAEPVMEVKDRKLTITEWKNGRIRFGVWRTLVLMFSRINKVHAWLTDAGKWIQTSHRMQKKKHLMPNDWKIFRDTKNPNKRLPRYPDFTPGYEDSIKK